MRKATEQERTRCTKNYAHGSAVLAQRVACDECEAPAVSAPANNESAHFFCGDHFKSWWAYQRSIRPSREELARRVTAGARA